MTVHNPHHFTFKKGVRYIIMSNHSSLYDIPVILRAIDTSVRMIAKKELFRVPIWGRAMNTAAFIEIDRGHSAKAIAALDLAKKKMSEGIAPWIAPEGTRSQDGRVGPFKKGGFMLGLQTDATILPVNITGTFDVLPKKTLLFTKGVDVTVTIGKPVDASQYNKDSRDEFMALVRSGIALDERPQEANPQ